MNTSTRSSLIKEAFIRLLAVNIMVQLVTNVNIMIDSMFVGNMFGTRALAAIGFITPLTAAFNLLDIIVNGAQIVTGKMIGAGERKRVNSLFYSCLITVFAIPFILVLLIYGFRFEVAGLLGASGETQVILSSYMAGFLPSLPLLFRSKYYMSLISFNNDHKLSYISIIAMLIVNITGNMFLGATFGILGIGLASTLCNLTSSIILSISFIRGDKAIRLSPQAYNVSSVFTAMQYGLPFALTMVGITVKNAMTNLVLNRYVGDDGMAAMNIMVTVCSIAGAFATGSYCAFVVLAGIYYGEDDRESYIELTRVALSIGVTICLVMTVLVMLFSAPLTGLFVSADDPAAIIIRRMLLLVPMYTIPNTILYILIKSYQVQGRKLIVSIFSFLDPFLQGLFALCFVPVIGADAAWLSLTLVDIALILILAVIAIIKNGNFQLSIPAIQMLDPEFGAKEEDVLERSASNTEEVAAVSDEAVRFCAERGISKRIAHFTGICIEEMGNNVVQHGFKSGRRNRLYIRLVTRNGLIIRFRDDCPEFDPKKRMSLFENEDPTANIGIRLVSGLASDIEYFNNAGINTLQIRM